MVLSNKSTFEWKCSYSKVPLTDSYQSFFVFDKKLMKLGEVVVCIEYYNIIKFFKNSDETQNFFCITHLTDGSSVSGRWIGPKNNNESVLVSNFLCHPIQGQSLKEGVVLQWWKRILNIPSSIHKFFND